MKRCFAWFLLIAMLVSMGMAQGALAEAEKPNEPGTAVVMIQGHGLTAFVRYSGSAMNEERGMMGVTVVTVDAAPLYSVGMSDARELAFTIPLWAEIIVDGVTLQSDDLEFVQDGITWFFDTDQVPDTLILYPHDDPDNLSARVHIDTKTGLIVDASALSQTTETVFPLTLAETQQPAPMPPAVYTNANVNAALAKLAEETTDPWRKAIYEAGARDVAQSDGVVSFALRSFNPGLKDLGDYEKDKDAWMAGFAQAVQAYDLAVSLDFSKGDEPTSTSLTALKSAVNSAASKSKNAFDEVAVRVAIAERMLPLPTETLGSGAPFVLTKAYSALLTSDDMAQLLVPLYYAQTSQKMSVADGPHALKLKCKGIDSLALLEEMEGQVISELSKRHLANNMTEDEIEAYAVENLCARAEVVREKSVSSYDFIFDIDAFFEGDFGEDYDDYMKAYTDDYETVLLVIAYRVWGMPDYPALDFPKSGRISGSTRGVKVIVRAPEGAEGFYVQFRKAETDELSVDLFVRPGGYATIYTPKGMYYVMIASGETWYGLEDGLLFGDYGNYTQTENTEIKGGDYYYTLTLQVEDGNVGGYKAAPAAFF
ncbi:MAG: hypothetical protein LBM74_06255 [Oscillospiraceae bacterium]|jgi:hypothetical protein|nr:hypothetical protein [Oscillospiraceae bacterium]